MPIQKVTSGIIADGAIVATDIADGTVTGPKLGANSVSSNNIIASVTLTTPIISGNLNLDTAGTTGIRVPAANTITFHTNGTEDVRIDATGNVGIGTTTINDRVTITHPDETGITFKSTGTDGVTAARILFEDTNGGTGGVLRFDHDVNSFTFATAGTTERMRIDSIGNFLVATTATQNISGVNTDHTFIGTTNTGRWVSGFINNSASSPYGLAVSYTGSAPNATGNQFLFCRDTGGTRFEVRSNGGIANYSANDVNLSDEREKTNIQLAGSYLDKICAIPIKTFKYIDQNQEEDDGLTLGVIAQDVQAVAPELVMESDWGTEEEPKMRLSIYQTDLQYALMKCIQEQQAMIEELKTKVTALENANK